MFKVASSPSGIDTPYVGSLLLKLKLVTKPGVVGGVRKVGSCISADDEYLVVRGNIAFLMRCGSWTTGVFGVGGAAEPAVMGDLFR